ncbi:glycosyltransferase family 17 protein [Acrodontium crateriforme]|uniref:Glycosyltransferase family 17 protein n=1 Tax=Acrodontium crateriforme TaxID=150365 RepID=A0AAQ3M777_9PEZI|nr:glycosyltransferase family 17 protein [Acrodontium crateriforme]
MAILATRGPPCSMRLLVFVSISLLLVIGLTSRYISQAPTHVLQLDGLQTHRHDLQEPAKLPFHEVAQICQDRGFAPFDASGIRPRRVYDLFLLWKELDWLEIRLNTLAPYVDYFIIVEEPTTFTGLPKPLYLKNNWDRFAAFHDKIIYKVVEDPNVAIGSAWEHESFMRNAMLDKVFPDLMGTEKQAQQGDVLLVSDIDEIPKPETITVLRLCEFPARLTLRSHFYYYSFQWLHHGAEWAHPQATTYKGDSTIRPQDLRMGSGPWGLFFSGAIRAFWQKADLWDAAWHCSSCFATLEQMKQKMASFSHKEYNTEKNRESEVVIERVRHGWDLFNRTGQTYDRVNDNQDVPSWILKNRDKFGYMLDRDGENAGFVDWAVQSAAQVD